MTDGEHLPLTMGYQDKMIGRISIGDAEALAILSDPDIKLSVSRYGRRNPDGTVKILGICFLPEQKVQSHPIILPGSVVVGADRAEAPACPTCGSTEKTVFNGVVPPMPWGTQRPPENVPCSDAWHFPIDRAEAPPTSPTTAEELLEAMADPGEERTVHTHKFAGEYVTPTDEPLGEKPPEADDPCGCHPNS